MFDIVGVTPVVITGFDVNLTGTATIEVYTVTAGTTYVGNEANPGAWTLLGTAPNVVGAGAGVPTTVPIILNVSINPSQTRGFYVTTTAGNPRVHQRHVGRQRLSRRTRTSNSSRASATSTPSADLLAARLERPHPLRHRCFRRLRHEELVWRWVL
jgi:hypothetical protein